MNLEIEPKYDWVVVEEDKKPESVSEAGIIMASGMSEEVRRGIVVAIGMGKAIENGCIREPQTPVGAYVIFQDVGHVFMVGAKPYRAIKEEDIICQVTNRQ